MVILAEEVLRNIGIHNNAIQRPPKQRLRHRGEPGGVLVFLPCAMSNFRPEAIGFLGVREEWRSSWRCFVEPQSRRVTEG